MIWSRIFLLVMMGIVCNYLECEREKYKSKIVGSMLRIVCSISFLVFSVYIVDTVLIIVSGKSVIRMIVGKPLPTMEWFNDAVINVYIILAIAATIAVLVIVCAIVLEWIMKRIGAFTDEYKEIFTSIKVSATEKIVFIYFIAFCFAVMHFCVAIVDWLHMTMGIL